MARIVEYSINLTSDYFYMKKVKFFIGLLCWNISDIAQMTRSLQNRDIRSSFTRLDLSLDLDVEMILDSDTAREGLGVLMDTECPRADDFLEKCSARGLFNSTYNWLILARENKDFKDIVHDSSLFGMYPTFDQLKNYNMCVDAEIAVAVKKETPEGLSAFDLYDVYNHGQHIGGKINITALGNWNAKNGLSIHLKQDKYQRRSNFHLVQLRVVTVMIQETKQDNILETLTSRSFTYGVNAMTKIASEVLELTRAIHNYSVLYIVEDRWAGVNDDGSHVGLMGALQRHEADISSTAFRIWGDRLDHATFFVSAFKFQSAFFFRNPVDGLGPYRNEFFRPFEADAWAASLVALVLCLLALAAARPTVSKVIGGLFDIISIVTQQEFLEGPESYRDIRERYRIKGHNAARIVICVTCLMSLLLYNYYTSSVVSFLLSAVPTAINSLPELVSSKLELIFEDIGYTRSLIENPNFSFQLKWHREERIMVDKRVKIADRKKPIYVSVEEGIELARQGGFAYHTEQAAAYPIILRKFTAAEICDLNTLITIPPTDVYFTTQRNSPYTEIFAQTLQKARERGHLSRAQRLFAMSRPVCEQASVPSAVSLGGAAPALAFLAIAGWLGSFLVMAIEVYHHRRFSNTRFNVSATQPLHY